MWINLSNTISLLNLIPLQSLNQFKMESKPANTAIFVFLLAGIIAVIVILNVSKKFKDSAIFNGGAVDIKLNKTTVSHAFYEAAKKYGLKKTEFATLERILKSGEMDPVKALNNENDLDYQFKRELQKIERNSKEDNTENEKAAIFSLRNTLDYFSSASRTSNSKAIRIFRRKNINIEGTYVLVQSETQTVGRKTTKKLVIKGDKVPCTIVNISLGGCAFKASKSEKAGTMIRFNFSVHRESVAVLGQVLRINVERGNAIIHVKFLKMSKKTENIINSLIFDY
ncbi:MAG: hypothetical protein Ta2F_09250 [Termitinemataceae bacterium]|nr:MAG: hypothetical protein Ta2F_09250 [Termitinemataceae bacterium]